MSGKTGLNALTSSSEEFSLIEAVGGVRGIFEAVIPFLTFMVLFMVSQNLWLSLAIVVVILAGIVILRLMQRQTLVGALSGVMVTLISVMFAALRGSARDFYSPGIWINAIFLIVLLISLIVRKPGIGWFLDTVSSRTLMDSLKREYTWATWVWVAGFALRLGSEIPLYVTHNVGALGIMRIITGIPLFAVMLLISWIIIAPARKKIIASTPDTLNNEK